MATLNKTLTNNKWIKLSDAGQNGSMWLNKLGEGAIFVDHSVNAGAANYDVGAVGIAAGLDLNKSFILTKNTQKSNILAITADNANDIYYAAYVDARPATPETAILTTDFSS